MMMFGQTRIFFTMSRDGLLPDVLSSVHPRFFTPHVITMLTGVVVSICAALFPVGKLADTSNSGTLLAFAMVSLGVLILRKQQPNRPRPFRTPLAWIVCPLADLRLPAAVRQPEHDRQDRVRVWAAIGLDALCAVRIQAQPSRQRNDGAVMIGHHRIELERAAGTSTADRRVRAIGNTNAQANCSRTKTDSRSTTTADAIQAAAHARAVGTHRASASAR